MLSGRRPLAIDIIFASLFGVTVLFAESLLIPVLLYDTPGCPPGTCVPMAPRIRVLPLLGGVMTAVTWSLLHARGLDRGVVARGLVLGLGGLLIGAAIDVARIPFSDPYFTLPYKVYALAFLAGASAVGAAAAGRSADLIRSRGFIRTSALALASAFALALAEAIFERNFLVAGAALIGAIGGWASVRRLGHWRGRLSERGALAGLVIVAFAMRALFGLQTLARTGPGEAFALASDDGDSYFALASKLATDPAAIGEILRGVAFPPGYTLFLAGLLAFGGMASVVVVQAILGAISVVLVFGLARHVVSANVALLAAALFALDQNLIQNGSTLTAESLLMPQVLGALFALARYRVARRARWLVAAAALIGWAFVTRNVVAIPLAVAGVMWVLALHRAHPLRAMTAAAVIAAALLVFSAPIGIATGQHDGSPRLMTQLVSVAWTFDGGERDPLRPELTVSNRLLIDRGIDPFTDLVGSLVIVVRDPLPVVSFYAWAVPQRLSTLLFFANPGYSDPITIVNDAWFHNAFGETIRLGRLCALIAGIAAVLYTRLWRRSPVAWLLASYALLYLAVFLFLFPPYHPFRYRIPIEPIRFIAEAAGIVLIARTAATAMRAGPRPVFPGSVAERRVSVSG